MRIGQPSSNRSPRAAKARPGGKTSSWYRTGREAIRLAVSRAGRGDTVLLLGKGHEGSIIGPSGPAPWDERAEAERALRELGYEAGGVGS